MSASAEQPAADAAVAEGEDLDATLDDPSASDNSDATGSGIESDAEPDVGELTTRIAAIAAQRDEYLDQLQRQRAEFQNFRRRVTTDRQQQVSAGVSRLVDSLLPVLDGCDAAVAQGHDEVAPVAQSLMVALGKAGLERITAVGTPFDPNEHEAVIVEQAPPGADAGSAALNADTDGSVASEGVTGSCASAAATTGDHDGAGGDTVQMVIEELRSGYRFDGRVLRAAMVKVRAG
ncbi:nucleotide exchange factor GrpE [Candidatus Poriferisodalis sp.]|uniref:nucleotide exchange factor GrpE n=1 Tax=Candidatus Poriferisodalis sp. TaxID=3101277 RepID=UPI003D0FD4EE